MTDLINILLPPAKIKLKVGLFFGSFNPPHIGHMAIANYMVEFAGINQLWFIVSPRNPLKEEGTLLKEYDRLELVRLAVEGDLRFRVSDVEFRMPKPSYTIHTLTYLKEKFPDHTFTLILGSDNLQNFRLWKDYETILENYQIIVYPRPGYSGENIPRHKNIKWIEAPMMDISSTFIRDSINAGKDVRYFVTTPVWEYMDKMNYYRNMQKS
jgi:nicotinate-nucleotide adenylyltransferase